MIVRIATEGQYEVADEDVAELNKLDNAAVASCETSDEASFHEVYEQLLDYVRSHGKKIDDLIGSDIILPPPDVSLAEASSKFTGDGLIPD